VIERMLEQLVPVAGPAASGEHLETAAPRVFAIVGGAFLAAEEDAGWLVSARLRISVRLQRYAERLGEHWESTGQWSRATQLYQRMIEIDPLAATFQRRHLLCLRAEGRRSEAIEAYRRWRHLLATTVGVDPDPELERLYRELFGSS
jgi:DNA-binding SARP family transcriptional activator